ncbi:MAG: phytanoyl-CoA dioxygenase family protein [bacterium]|nr:phytanoyl-CoA dioxygenase family protein [bacterium]
MLPYTPVAEEDIAFFDQNGYLIVRNALDEDTINSLIEAGDRLIASDRTQNRQRSGDLYDGFRNSITLEDAFIPLIDHPKILPIVVQLLGANLQVMTSHLIYKHPDPKDFPVSHRHPGWHRDYAQATNDMGNAAIPRLLVKCAYYLTDLTEPNRGATMVAPGSNHLLGRPEIPEGEADPIDAVEPSLQPGDCLIFENRTFHAGAVHRGSNTRKAIMVGYGYRWVVPMDYVTQPQEFLEKLTPLQKYLVGEPIEEMVEYLPRGGRNPIKEWCDEHSIPATRHPEPQSR